MAEEINELSTSELLTEVDNAIYAICLGGQSYKIGSRQLNRADLKTLYEMKKNLTAQVAAGNGSLLDACYVAVFDGR